MENIVSIKSLSKAFGSHRVLKNIDLDIKKGEFITIFGPNGAGKTTLMRIMSTLVEPSAGSISIDGFDVKDEPVEIRKRIGSISHETYLYNELTAEENLRFFGRMYGMDKNHLDARVDELIEQVGLEYRSNDRVGTFSRGMKQRLSIARALIHEPPILFLDEPYTGLDQHAASTFEHVLRGLDAQNTTKVMISHNIDRSLKMCDRVLILNNGNIVFDKFRHEVGSVDDFKNTYESFIHE
ncbi:MAG: heme ABC exporter ATP-binding protein CcmA [Methanosarcinaceae archaeon]|nr:heme ABC exporter ATP-binding protein CcmA [Methanosarcinaceae archaeon]MDF1533282.1 heme ABC exporter ATP-binding protein CcmA [Methanosarcinaceae archaeon]